MDGIAAVRSVLVADAGVTALVPAAKIVAGPLPLSTQPPALSLTMASLVDRNIPAPGLTRHVTERGQVTVLARNLPEQKNILRAVRDAAADQFNPVVPGISGVRIQTEGGGPDFMNEEA